MGGRDRARALAVFAEWLDRTGDYRVAAERAGVSARTGRRWRQQFGGGARTGHSSPSVGLPAYRTRFVGRRRDLDALARCAADARLVTLLGYAGLGKTRLAVHYARTRSREAACAGVWFCDLQAATCTDDVCSAVAQLLGLDLAPGGPDGAVQRIGEEIARTGSSLWVFDGCEDLHEHAPETIGQWIDAAPSAQFLATSRRRLRLTGEATLALDSLPVPDDPGASWPEISKSPAVELFVDRASLARPTYEVSPPEAAAIAGIARQLEGIPLAIELAAARISVMDPAQLLVRLQEHSDLMGRGLSDAPDRQRTVSGTVDWTWGLLSEAERSALAQVAVFRGGFTLEAAEAVVALSTMPHAPVAALLLESLRDRSLLRTQEGAGGGIRFALFEIVREYAAGKLANMPEAAGARRRHALFYAALVQAPASVPNERERAENLDVLATEMGNLTAALHWATGGQGATVELARCALQVAVALDPLFSTRGPLATHIDLLDRALAAADGLEVDASLRAQALEARSRALIYQGQPAAARDALGTALELARGAGDRWTEGRVLLSLGRAELTLWEGDKVPGYLEQALAVHREVGDRHSEGRALSNLGLSLYRSGDAKAARPPLEQAMVIHRDIGDRAGAAHTLSFLGALNHAPPNHDLARGYYGEALAIYRDLGLRWRAGVMLANLGVVEQEAGRFRAARQRYDEALALARQTGARGLEAIVETLLGTLLHERGRLRDARATYETALAITGEVVDNRYRGVVLALLGALDAGDDAVDESEERFEQARIAIRAVGDPTAEATVAVLEGHLDLARARRAHRDGADEEHDSLVAQASGRADAPNEGMRLSEDVRFAQRILQRALGHSSSVAAESAGGTGAARDENALQVTQDGRHVRTPSGARVDLSRRIAPRRLVQRLATERIETPGKSLPISVLFEAGWPAQNIRPSSAVNRVHVALTALRNLGLREVLQSSSDGYRFDPDVPLQLVAELDLD